MYTRKQITFLKKLLTFETLGFTPLQIEWLMINDDPRDEPTPKKFNSEHFCNAVL